VGTLVQLSNVSFYPDEPFGLNRVNFDLLWGKRYVLKMNDPEQLSAVLGILEGRYKADGGVVYKTREYLCQSDRLHLEDRVYRKKLGPYLAVEAQPFMNFGGRRRSKQILMEEMKAWHLRHFQIYRLRGEEKTKFSLLALGFQESGLLIISQLQKREFTEPMEAFLHDMIETSPCTILLAIAGEDLKKPLPEWVDLERFEVKDLTQANQTNTPE